MTVGHCIYFVIPAPNSFTSGGNLYNQHLIHALKAKGQVIQEINFETFEKNYCTDSDVVFFIDTLYFDALKGFTKSLKNCFLIVHHLESLYPVDSNGKKVFEEKERMILERFDGFLTSSQFTTNYLFEMGLGHKKWLTIPPALCFEPEPKRKDSSKMNVLLVNNLIERKGILPFLNALQNLEIDPDKCQIRIVGSQVIEPDYAQRCLHLIQSDKKLSALIRYEGESDHTQLQEFYQLANLFISASSMETYGMALQEAVAHHIWLLAMDAGNVSNHIDEGKNGCLFSSMDGLVTCLEQLSEKVFEFDNIVEKAWNYRVDSQYNWSIAANNFFSYFLKTPDE